MPPDPAHLRPRLVLLPAAVPSVVGTIASNDRAAALARVLHAIDDAPRTLGEADERDLLYDVIRKATFRLQSLDAPVRLVTAPAE